MVSSQLPVMISYSIHGQQYLSIFPVHFLCYCVTHALFIRRLCQKTGPRYYISCYRQCCRGLLVPQRPEQWQFARPGERHHDAYEDPIYVYV